MADFTQSYAKLLGFEGGYSNNPRDKGGRTYQGIAENFHPREPMWRIINAATHDPEFPDCLEKNDDLQAMVRNFYKTRFWDVWGGDTLPQQVADELFEFFVNSPAGCALAVQRMCNILNNQGSRWPDIEQDGQFGPVTRGTLQKLLVRYGAKYFVAVLNRMQFAFYLNVLESHPDQEEFARGWILRTMDDLAATHAP